MTDSSSILGKLETVTWIAVRGPWNWELGNGAPGRMFDASLERLSVTETSYNNSLAERAPRSTIQTLPATLPEPWS